MPEPIDPTLLTVALDRANGAAFEDYVNQVFAALLGIEFVPLGGTADGGADGLLRDHLREDSSDPSHFLQTSTEERVASKIRRTVERLRQVEREPRWLTYVSSRVVPKLDLLELRLGQELDVNLHIRDRKYLQVHLNHSPATQAAFEFHLRPFTEFLKQIGASKVISASSHVTAPEVFVFLRQELERREGDYDLTAAVLDALVIWSLEGTDPDEGKFMTAGQVRIKILEQLPSVRPFVDTMLPDRLEALSSKHYPGGRAIRCHRKEGLYCLPYEARLQITADNAEDEALRIDVRDRFRERLADVLPEATSEGLVEAAAAVTLRTIDLIFEGQGLEFAHFLADDSVSDAPAYITDALASALEGSHAVYPTNIDMIGDAVLETLRQSFYRSTPEERLYFGKLSRTYSLLFILRSDPRILDYFQQMTAEFNLYVGTDIFIRALSERYLDAADQMTRNMLRLAAEAGARLVLTEPVLEEVVSHIRASDHEYHNYVEPVQRDLSLDFARQVPKILVRAYLYATFNQELERPPRSWAAFVQQFCDYGHLHRPEAMGAMRAYLQGTFHVEFESREDLEKVVPMRAVAELSDALSGKKADPRLADNDALMAYAMYGIRKRDGEATQLSEFGFKTWWLTTETAILRHTAHVVKAHHGERYMMPPDFLINFIALAPSTAEAREAYRAVFPTLLGIRLARRMNETAFHKVMSGVGEAAEMEEGRKKASISQMANQLMSDFRKQYRVQLPEL